MYVEYISSWLSVWHLQPPSRNNVALNTSNKIDRVQLRFEWSIINTVNNVIVRWISVIYNINSQHALVLRMPSAGVAPHTHYYHRFASILYEYNWPTAIYEPLLSGKPPVVDVDMFNNGQSPFAQWRPCVVVVHQ